jgi:hypothetical protein
MLINKWAILGYLVFRIVYFTMRDVLLATTLSTVVFTANHVCKLIMMTSLNSNIYKLILPLQSFNLKLINKQAPPTYLFH